MAVLASAMKMLNVLGVAGCAERDKDSAVPGKAQAKRTPETSKSMTTPSTSAGTPSSISVSSSLSSYRGQRSQACRLPPGHWLLEYQRYAYNLEDMDLLAIYLELAEVPGSFSSKGTKLLLTMLRFLRSLDIPVQDICCLLSHASIYFKDIHPAVAANMNREELANVLVLLVFLAHSHVHDETCQLKVWHRYLFKSYCNLPTLSKATMELMKRRDYKLRVADYELSVSLKIFAQVTRLPEEAVSFGVNEVCGPIKEI
ncbi:unnamed protein product [Effrenium voratum]|nr:unnamed protein product [Effrenium voratum]|mmetsp:Transcript_95249/g.226846  ORF Transcript_95249/g.226846 Transcript_95249/m.226846 type:complete len:257 (-) Transcript_95249:62-832(-)|eukprot:CAMPEP_0181486594 /NCGR_PEP_ID=MMETSP1110-20121109/47275_1 /TAXON_ID=174948 /ORGANISM="Symbiodinium sp., Strain CCMP421" /LENGTH=256 /DNA_ID=CAMNT_0023612857 /DNA_START=64 /DNA_END=834 /DNA_ORIENTATION=-